MGPHDSPAGLVRHVRAGVVTGDRPTYPVLVLGIEALLIVLWAVYPPGFLLALLGIVIAVSVAVGIRMAR